ncbi:formate/nitrite transporter family protein [Aestuariispira insulae]|uniref:Formate/nitrite transporter n=1 Tax=Aestuariispira insulae TaxID=1461337 RepID=A0A3D9HJJ3_9PROT|nr:formate/nitrite transporter family protein [Aestuariispira insulae]RED49638.1 formate/nitrite transporter [Aestuariispira insulae]
MTDPVGYDAYAPKEMAARVENAGIGKAALAFLPLMMLAVLAGAFIAFGGMFYTMAITDSALGLGLTRLIGGVAFSLGLILVVVGGAELFTGNVLIVMACADGKVTVSRLLRNWTIAYAGNFVGAAGAVILAWHSGMLGIGEGAVAATAAKIAAGKTTLGWDQALIRGILCNILVCLAVWLCFSARRVSGKILSILFPITAFVALGFEHSIANMYLIPIGQMAGGGIDLEAFLNNLVPVTLGNIIGGGIFVAAVYYLIYIRPERAE